MRNVVTASNTLWVFATCSQEARHLDDIIFAIDVLRARGVEDRHVRVFVDHPRPRPHFDPYGIERVLPFTELERSLAAAPRYDAAFLIIGGHGSELGLRPHGTEHYLRPSTLFARIRSVTGVRFGAVLVTQCFGGIFNFADASEAPPLAVFGAANLNPSMSMAVRLTTPVLQRSGAPGLSSWVANVFAYDFFVWLRKPVDVDGDGRLTAMDAFKYAGAVSNGRLRQSRPQAFIEAQRKMQELQEATSAGESELRVGALETQFQQLVEWLYLNHEPWILNARLASSIELAF